MHKARAFFYVCAGLFLLALAYHFGAVNAMAQAGGTISGFAANGDSNAAACYVITPGGDVYARQLCANVPGIGCASGPLTYLGNIWGGGPVPTTRESFGSLKSRYRGTPGGAQPAQDR